MKKSVKTSHHNDRKHTIRQKAWRIAGTCLSFIALVFALTAIVILCMKMNGNAMTQDFQPASEVKQYSRFCFKCALVGDYPDHHPKHNPLLEMLNNLTRHEIDDHNSECCVENDRQFKALVAFLSASLITNQDVKLPINLLPAASVSAHKHLLREQHSTDKKYGEHFPLTLNTSSHDPSYEHVRGVDVTKDGFIVKYTGLYYVYSSVQFKRQQVTDKTLYHYLHRISFNNPMQTGVLLRSVHTICQSCPQSQETSFAGGIFYLKSADKVQVCVSALGVVDEQGEAMYMGLTMLNA
ncbi:unnamed protein product [Lymnaea stagnalis]|uniref:THD domain-containing protein n=1 Tax=Lymnaea stagnalis TaxID=6523 RepID=A0AAV2HA05_LYMST